MPRSSQMLCVMLGSLVFGAALGSVVWAKADVERTDETISFVGLLMFNPCTDEFMELTGELHVRTQTVTDANGGMKVTVHERLSAKGVGEDSGERYVVNDRSSESERINANNAQTTLTFNARTRLIAPGNRPNAYLTRTVVLVVDANGQTRVDEDLGLAIECR